MFYCLLCATTSMLDFLLAMTFQSFCLSQSIPVMDFQYWSCKSWVSVLVLNIKVLVLVLVLNLRVLVSVLVLEKQVLNPSLTVSVPIIRLHSTSVYTHKPCVCFNACVSARISNSQWHFDAQRQEMNVVYPFGQVRSQRNVNRFIRLIVFTVYVGGCMKLNNGRYIRQFCLSATFVSPVKTAELTTKLFHPL